MVYQIYKVRSLKFNIYYLLTKTSKKIYYRICQRLYMSFLSMLFFFRTISWLKIYKSYKFYKILFLHQKRPFLIMPTKRKKLKMSMSVESGYIRPKGSLENSFLFHCHIPNLLKFYYFSILILFHSDFLRLIYEDNKRKL